MNYKEANSKSNTFLIIAMILFVGSLLIQQWILQMICLVGGLVLIVVAIVLRVKYSKCPHCKKKLPLGFRRISVPIAKKLLLKVKISNYFVRNGMW